MVAFEFGRRRLFVFIVTIGVLILVLNLFFLTGEDLPSRISHIPIPGRPPLPSLTPIETFPDEPPLEDLTSTSTYLNSKPTPLVHDVPNPEPSSDVLDLHPIATFMSEADAKWREYEGSRSQTFKQTVEKYRRKYGRHPPPGFVDWYKFARQRNVFNIDDFEQVMDDLRPFWAIEPSILRKYAAHMWENAEDGISGLHIRNQKVAKITNVNWRIETLETLVKQFVKYLPDMDLAMNCLDQPRLVVPWEDMQVLLAREYETRSLPPEALDSFTSKPSFLTDLTVKNPEDDPAERMETGWFGAPGKQYMDIASLACPPESPARANLSISDADKLYKSSLGGLITNFNLSSDLCTVGPAIQNLHGFLYSSSSVVASKRLLPVFGECKVNVNNDILFPANMYWRHDERYDYLDKEDVDWEEKEDVMVWRGVTSGGVQIPENWSTMHRQRLVQLTNGTFMGIEGKEVTVLSQTSAITDPDNGNITYENFHQFRPSNFADNHTDIGFVEAWGCIPAGCPFYETVFSWKPQVSLTKQFRFKYLIDVDGHSFSGRWRAFLESKSLGFKATIFREWHDSRLFAWRHFIPMDNRYDDIYSLLTYFIGYGKPGQQTNSEDDYVNGDVYIKAHDLEAKKIARQGREWAGAVLRRDDIEIYTYRLLLEYARIVDDNRDKIGYSGDGSELDKFDEKLGQGGGSLWGLGDLLGSGKDSPPEDHTDPVEAS